MAAETKQGSTEANAMHLVCELLAAGGHFQLPDLVAMCTAKLTAIVSADNAAELLMLADTCHAPELKVSVCMCFAQTKHGWVGAETCAGLCAARQ